MTTAQERVTTDAAALKAAAAQMALAAKDVNAASTIAAASALTAAQKKTVHTSLAKAVGVLVAAETAANSSADAANTWVTDNPVVTPPPPPPPTTVPSAPTGLTATAGGAQASFKWSAPSSNGGAAITGYRVYLDGKFDQTSTTPTDTLTGLTNGTAYSVTVSAVNSVGEGPQSAAVSVTPVAVTPPPPPATGIKSVLHIMFENQQTSNVFGNADAPYINSLLVSYPALRAAYGSSHPSLGNYISAVTGQLGLTTDDSPPSSYPKLVGTPNIFGQLDTAKLGWSLWAESLVGSSLDDEGPVDASGNALYAVHHNPAAYVLSAAEATAKCVPFTTAVLSAYLDESTFDAYMFVVPNMDDNMHDPVGTAANDAGAVKAGDAWLSTNLPAIMATTWFKAGGIVLVTWDEAYDTSGAEVAGGFGSPAVTGGPVPGLVISAALDNVPATAFPSSEFDGDWTADITHIGILQSIEKYLGLPQLGALGQYGDISPLLEYSPGAPPVTPPVTPPSGGYASGFTIPASLPGFTRNFQDFKNGIDSSFWSAAYDGAPGGTNGMFLPSHVAVVDELLTIESYQDSASGDSASNEWAGGGIQTQTRWPVGTEFHFVIRKDAYPNWFAIDLLMGNNWPPEDDIIETDTINSDTESIHYAASNQQVQAQKSGLSLNDWTYVIHTWTPSGIVTTAQILNGPVITIAEMALPDTNASDPNSDVQPMFFSHQLQTEGATSPTDASVTAANPIKFQLEQFAAFVPS